MGDVGITMERIEGIYQSVLDDLSGLHKLIDECDFSDEKRAKLHRLCREFGESVQSCTDIAEDIKMKYGHWGTVPAR